MRQYELIAQHDSRASFYHKATVHILEDGTRELYSYNTLVCTTKDNEVTLIELGHSTTTNRHIKEFLKQEGFKAKNKAQMTKDYCQEENKTVLTIEEPQLNIEVRK